MTTTVEDIIEILAGNNKETGVLLNPKDVKLISSFACQIQKKIGFTDRQLALAKTKIFDYKNELSKIGIEVDDFDTNSLRLPIRKIDRKKSIFIAEKNYENGFDLYEEKMIGIKFPFSKKMIKHINFIKSMQRHILYESKTKTHYVTFTEKNVLALVDHFKDANFEIQNELLEYVKILCEILAAPEQHVPGVYNYKLKNVHPNCLKYSKELFGNPSKTNLFLYYDRRNLLGIENFNEVDIDTSLQPLSRLSKKIAHEISNRIYIDKNSYTFSEIFFALHELKRFPILVVLKTNHEIKYMTDIYKSCCSYVKSNEISVLFRLPNITDNNIEFNKIVQRLNFNNPVTEETKIIFLDNNKIPKPLWLSKWIPSTVVLTESFRPNRNHNLFYNTANLIIHYDITKSQMDSSMVTL